MPSKTDLAYAAGLLDGEAYIGITRGGTSSVPALQVGMTDEPVLRWLHETFGGNEPRVSRAANKKHKACWMWRSRNREFVLPLLESLLPYLRVKRPQALLVIEFCKRSLDGELGWREADDYVDRSKALSARGI